MNKILRFSLIAFMAMLGLNMSAQTVVTFDASEDKGTRGSDNPGEDQITKDGITIAFSNGCMNLVDHYRCYAGADFTITSTGDKILKVEITCTSYGDAKYGPGCFSDPDTGTYDFEEDGPVGTWMGNAASFSMNASKQVRIRQVVVTIGDAPDIPTFSIPGGVYLEPQTVTLNAEAGSFIIYTLNGEEPAYTDDTHYTGTKYDGNALTVDKNTTIKAIAVNEKGNTSYIASATYTIVYVQGEVTFDALEDKGTCTPEEPGEDQVTKDDVTIAVSYGCMNLNTQYRCYAGANLTISSAGSKIVKVEITCTTNGAEKYGPGCLTNPTEGIYTFEEEGNVGTWIGHADSFTMNADKQVRITKIVVTFDDTPVEPSFSQNQGLYFGEQKVTLSCGTGNFIIYTTNGDEPAYTDESHYTGTKYDGSELTISETTTIKAIAVNEKGKTSSIATATFSIVNTEGRGTVESPFSVADAIVVTNALKAEGLTPMFYIKGIVIGDITIENGQASFYIGDKADATTDLIYVWKTFSLEEQEYVEGDVKAGDEIVINTNLEIFAGNIETWHGYLYSINGQTSKPTGIEAVTAKKLEKSVIYNLQGIRVDNAQKGLYIINGKKLVVK